MTQSLSAVKFAHEFSTFCQAVEKQSGETFVSFRDGMPHTWEGYKSDLRVRARKLLQIAKWTNADIGSGRILKRVIQAIEIKPSSDGQKNNLVRWENRFGHERRAHAAFLDAQADASSRRSLERWFLDHFQRRITDQEAFDRILELIGKRYDLVAYLFFLNDATKFMPIAQETFDKAFSRLEIGLVTSRNCSWENYSKYNAALRAVQRALRDVGKVAEPSLLDAHSFCWMLVRLEPTASPSEFVIPLPTTIKVQKAPAVKLLPTPEPESVDSKISTADDFAARDAEMRRLGVLAQDIALRSERRRLKSLGHPNSEAAVQPKWDEPNRGYDILSCEPDGKPRHIEVKAARRGGGRLAFVLTQNEWLKSQSLPNYYFYLVTNPDSRKPKVQMANGKELMKRWLEPINYRVTIASDPE